MAFASSNVFQLWPGSLADGRNAGWFHLASDSTDGVYATGFLAGVMKGSRASSSTLTPLGLSTGDLVFTLHGTTAFSMGIITGSTIDQGTTAASTAYNFGFNGTLTMLTGL